MLLTLPRCWNRWNRWNLWNRTSAARTLPYSETAEEEHSMMRTVSSGTAQRLFEDSVVRLEVVWYRNLGVETGGEYQISLYDMVIYLHVL